ncbi:MAG TPA: response regulator [Polyangia bacterium]|nr:response regulator [Polyangia bacterium]
MSADGQRLLVIDDSLTIRKLVEMSFREAPFMLDFATTGTDGVAKASTGSADIVLLDCVLPDMKGFDVCQRLAQAEKARAARIILMSAKDRSVFKTTFESFPQVVDFLAKPFTAADVLARVKAAAAGQVAREAPPPEAPPPVHQAPAAPHEAPPPGTAGGLGAREAEAAAKALYARLARPLASMPEWLRQAGAAGTAAPSVPAFLARKLLTPELVSSLLESLLPIFRQALRAEAPATTEAHGAAPLQGEIAGWPLGDLLAMLETAGRTGELALSHGAQHLVTYWENGEVVLCTSHDPADYVHGASVDLAAVAPNLRARAEAEQRSSGTPVYVTLQEAGVLPASVDLCGLLHERSVRLLQEARAAATVRYAWRDRAPLPTYALGWGRHVSLGDDADGGTDGARRASEPTVAQLTLERLRRPSAWDEADSRLPPPDQSYDRAAGFSGKLRSLHLTASEQRVLALVDRQNPIRSIAARAGLPGREVARIAYRLAEIELIQPLPLTAPPASTSASLSLAGASAGADAPQRSVMILDGDAEGFCRPLREMLARRARPIRVVDLSGEPDLTGAISRERPGLVVLNQAGAPGRLEEIARAVRAAPHLAGTALAAVIDAGVDASPDALAAAGFDAVWTKPVHYLDLVALLGTESSAPRHQPPASAFRTE